MTYKVKLLLIVCSVFVAAIAIASNMGFKLNYNLVTNTAGNNVNWVSLPYFDNYSVAEDICTDINTVDCAAGTATSVKYFDTANNADVTHSCGSTKNNFNINAGISYGVFVSTSCTYKLVGSHDDSYDSTLGVSFLTNAAGNNINRISVPYHTQAAAAENLCTEINSACSNIVSSIKYFDTANNTDITHSCGSTKNNFSITPGTGYAAIVTAAGSSCWHPSHY